MSPSRVYPPMSHYRVLADPEDVVALVQRAAELEASEKPTAADVVELGIVRDAAAALRIARPDAEDTTLRDLHSELAEVVPPDVLASVTPKNVWSVPPFDEFGRMTVGTSAQPADGSPPMTMRQLLYPWVEGLRSKSPGVRPTDLTRTVYDGPPSRAPLPPRRPPQPFTPEEICHGSQFMFSIPGLICHYEANTWVEDANGVPMVAYEVVAGVCSRLDCPDSLGGFTNTTQASLNSGTDVSAVNVSKTMFYFSTFHLGMSAYHSVTLSKGDIPWTTTTSEYV
jgi:hypothetical protein